MAERCVPGGYAGLNVQIYKLKSGSPAMVGLYSPGKRIEGWGDLDGEVESYKGWWISTAELAQCVQDDNRRFEVSKDIEHRGVQLKGKICKMLANLDNGTVFVEFDEDVNGCSADGLGKTGHCVALNSNALKASKKKVKHA